MRLIDADELITAFPCGERAKVIEIINNNKAYASRVEQKIAVKKLSSVIPQPKEGEWVKVGDSVQPICSKCGMSCSGIHRNADYSVVPTWNYCPNCGARMFAKDIIVPNKKGAGE